LLKFLVVDHEAQVRSTLIRLCERSNDVDVIGEAASGLSAIDAAAKLCPDVMLLDVELPDMTGFEVLRAMPAETRPLGIMVTRRAEYAVTAFAEGALDCLVKPVNADRFDKALERARERLERHIAWVKPTQALRDSHQTDDLIGAPAVKPRLLVGERQHRFYPLDPTKIDYIEADGNYVTIRTSNTEYISRDSIKRLATELAELGFVRIERSLLMNTRAVLYAEMVGHGAFAFTLTSGACLHSSATYRDEILRVLPLAPVSKSRLSSSRESGCAPSKSSQGRARVVSEEGTGLAPVSR
jgi:two-component system, LytTR family, response regulator